MSATRAMLEEIRDALYESPECRDSVQSDIAVTFLEIVKLVTDGKVEVEEWRKP